MAFVDAATNQLYVYHHDATGHTVAITDGNQNIVNKYAYSAYGKVLAENELISQPFTYVGQYGVMREADNLYYMRARYYDADQGRFISEDPIGFAGGINVYAYVGSNPMMLVDPSGLVAERVSDIPSLDDSFTPSPSPTFTEKIGSFLADSWRLSEGINPARASAAFGASKLAVIFAAKAGPFYKTTKEATAAAKSLGFTKINETVHDGQAVYRRGKLYISRDLDGHNGGAWKMANSVKSLSSKSTRIGTFDSSLNQVGR